jgi:hypothetical protein
MDSKNRHDRGSKYSEEFSRSDLLRNGYIGYGAYSDANAPLRTYRAIRICYETLLLDSCKAIEKLPWPLILCGYRDGPAFLFWFIAFIGVSVGGLRPRPEQFRPPDGFC